MRVPQEGVSLHPHSNQKKQAEKTNCPVAQKGRFIQHKQTKQHILLSRLETNHNTIRVTALVTVKLNTDIKAFHTKVKVDTNSTFETNQTREIFIAVVAAVKARLPLVPSFTSYIALQWT